MQKILNYLLNCISKVSILVGYPYHKVCKHMGLLAHNLLHG